MKIGNVEIKKNYIIVLSVIILVVSLALGYSLLYSDLNYQANVTVKNYKCNQENLYERLTCLSTYDNTPSKNVKSYSGIDYNDISSDTNGKGLYTLSETLDTANPIRYFRGNVKNNNLKFASSCWKIIRTTSTGGIKLIYNGKPNDKGICEENGVSIGSYAFNDENLSVSDTSYMYGKTYEIKEKIMENTEIVYGNTVNWNNETNTYTISDEVISSSWSNDHNNLKNKYTCFNNETTCEKVNYISESNDPAKAIYIELALGETKENIYENISTNENSSSIKTILDKWYEDNIKAFENNLEDTLYCNDRTSLNGNAKKEMIFACPNKADSFSTKEENGNAKLTYPIALLTKEEIILSGLNTEKENTNYLTTNSNILTMTPAKININESKMVIISSMNKIDSLKSTEKAEIKPVISLKKDTLIVSGTGTLDDPYIIG